jgi:hypothetical protein
MILTGSTFGLHQILVGAVIDAHIGALFGCYSPRLGKKLFELLSEPSEEAEASLNRRYIVGLTSFNHHRTL